MSEEYPWNNDPSRIDALVESLRETWKLWPGMRLGQLIYNAASRFSDAPVDFYSVEDDLVASGLERMKRNGELRRDE